VDRLLRRFQRRIQKRLGNLHRVSDANEHQVAHALLQARCRFKCDQRAPTVADQRRLLQARGIEQRPHEFRGLLDAGWRLAFAAAMARQIDRQHVPPMVGHVAGLQHPHAVVVQHAMDEDDRGFRGVE
jgi:hypothetical protein